MSTKDAKSVAVRLTEEQIARFDAVCKYAHRTKTMQVSAWIDDAYRQMSAETASAGERLALLE